MKKEALYEIAVKTDKETKKDDENYCTFCFCSLIRGELRESSYFNDFLRWEEKNNIYTVCGSAMLYLQDLGIIKILSGTTTRNNGVVCKNLKYTINKNFFQGNKI